MGILGFFSPFSLSNRDLSDRTAGTVWPANNLLLYSLWK